jgi:hypothetical protein
MKFLLIFLLGYVLLRVVIVLVASFKAGLRGSEKKTSPRRSSQPKNGQVTVDYNPESGKRPKPKVGEYVDYEEISDSKK